MNALMLAMLAVLSLSGAANAAVYEGCGTQPVHIGDWDTDDVMYLRGTLFDLGVSVDGSVVSMELIRVSDQIVVGEILGIGSTATWVLTPTDPGAVAEMEGLVADAAACLGWSESDAIDIEVNGN